LINRGNERNYLGIKRKQRPEEAQLGELDDAPAEGDQLDPGGNVHGIGDGEPGLGGEQEVEESWQRNLQMIARI